MSLGARGMGRYNNHNTKILEIPRSKKKSTFAEVVERALAGRSSPFRVTCNHKSGLSFASVDTRSLEPGSGGVEIRAARAAESCI